MSYARWGEEGSAVYVFGTGHGIVCMHCKLAPFEEDYAVKSPAEMLAHLERHRQKGDVVPERAFERLREEAKQ